MSPVESLKSIKEVSGIFVEAAADIANSAFYSGRLLLAQTVERIDTHFANNINGEDDER